MIDTDTTDLLAAFDAELDGLGHVLATQHGPARDQAMFRLGALSVVLRDLRVAHEARITEIRARLAELATDR